MSHHLNDSTKLEPCDHVDLSGPGKKAICVKASKTPRLVAYGFDGAVKACTPQHYHKWQKWKILQSRDQRVHSSHLRHEPGEDGRT